MDTIIQLISFIAGVFIGARAIDWWEQRRLQKVLDDMEARRKKLYGGIE